MSVHDHCPAFRGRHLAVLLGITLLGGVSSAWGQQQSFGHKLLGTLGLQAGSQVPAGLYVGDRAVFYFANELKDRNGDPIDVGLDLDAFGNGFGAAFAWKAPLQTYLNVSLSVPVSRVRLNTDRPEASIDRFGLGDLYFQPLKLGWRLPRGDIVAGYAFYAPTGKYEPGGVEGVGLGRWSHEVSAGGTAWLDGARTWAFSALSSYQWNMKNRGIDLTRGSTLQIQGGLGKTLFRILELGPTAYALWQVSDDRGSDLPEALRGARDRDFGLGAEAGLLVPKLRTKLNLRYCRDFGSRSRPQGQVIVLGLSVAAWMPGAPGASSEQQPLQ